MSTGGTIVRYFRTAPLVRSSRSRTPFDLRGPLKPSTRIATFFRGRGRSAYLEHCRCVPPKECAKLSLGRGEETVDRLRRSIEANRNDPMSHLVLAAALARLGRLAALPCWLSSGGSSSNWRRSLGLPHASLRKKFGPEHIRQLRPELQRGPRPPHVEA